MKMINLTMKPIYWQPEIVNSKKFILLHYIIRQVHKDGKHFKILVIFQNGEMAPDMRSKMSLSQGKGHFNG